MAWISWCQLSLAMLKALTRAPMRMSRVSPDVMVMGGIGGCTLSTDCTGLSTVVVRVRLGCLEDRDEVAHLEAPLRAQGVGLGRLGLQRREQPGRDLVDPVAKGLLVHVGQLR